MNHDRPTGTRAPGTGPGHGVQHDDLTERVAAALRSREPDAATTAAMTRQITARAETARGQVRSSTPFARRAGTIAVTGVVASALGVVGAGAAAAANPYTDFAAAVDGAAHAVGVEWSSMPEGYTREQYEAFWGAEYSGEDLTELQALWSLDETETKARAGQLILDGEELPFEPGTHTAPALPAGSMAAAQAFISSDYTAEDLAVLSELWDTGEVETKVRAGQMLLDGKNLPLP